MAGAWRFVCRDVADKSFGLHYSCSRNDDQSINRAEPMLVSFVAPLSAADLSGLSVGDRIIAVAVDWETQDISKAPSDCLMDSDIELSLRSKDLLAFLVYVTFPGERCAEKSCWDERVEYLDAIRKHLPSDSQVQSSWIYNMMEEWDRVHNKRKQLSDGQEQRNKTNAIASLLNAASPSISPLESPSHRSTTLAFPSSFEEKELFSGTSSVVNNDTTQVTISMHLQPTHINGGVDECKATKEPSKDTLYDGSSHVHPVSTTLHIKEVPLSSSNHSQQLFAQHNTIITSSAMLSPKKQVNNLQSSSSSSRSVAEEPLVSEELSTHLDSEAKVPDENGFNPSEQHTRKSSQENLVRTPKRQKFTQNDDTKRNSPKHNSGLEDQSVESKLQSPLSSDLEELDVPIALPVPTWQCQIKQNNRHSNCEVQVARKARIVVASSRIQEGTELFL